MKTTLILSTALLGAFTLSACATNDQSQNAAMAQPAEQHQAANALAGADNGQKMSEEDLAAAKADAAKKRADLAARQAQRAKPVTAQKPNKPASISDGKSENVAVAPFNMTGAIPRGNMGGEWQILMMDGEALVEQNIGWTFKEGRVFGTTGCNSFSGSYSMAGNNLSFSPAMAMTRKACVSRESLLNMGKGGTDAGGTLAGDPIVMENTIMQFFKQPIMVMQGADDRVLLYNDKHKLILKPIKF